MFLLSPFDILLVFSIGYTHLELESQGPLISPSSQVSLVGGWRRVERRHERQVEDIYPATLPQAVFFPHYNAIWYMSAYPGTIDAYIFIQLSKHFSKYLLYC